MAHQTAGGLQQRAGMQGMEGVDGVAPPVRVDPCAAFRLDHASAWPVCDACGWLEDDHAAAASADAVVTELPRRGVRLPERKAS